MFCWTRSITSAAVIRPWLKIARVIAAVAIIFGISGAWGWKLLLDAKAQLNDTGERVTRLSADLKGLEPTVQSYVHRLQQAGEAQLSQFQENADREAVPRNSERMSYRSRRQTNYGHDRSRSPTLMAKH